MFQIVAHGTIAGVKKIVESAKASGEKPTSGQVAQVEGVKGLLLSELAALPEDCNGCRINAEGDAHAGGRTLQVTIIPLKLHL